MGDNFRFNPSLFTTLDRAFGPLTIDRFATAANAVLPRFNSMFIEHGAEGTDAFAQKNWRTERNFSNTPFAQVARLVRFLSVEAYGSAAVVIAPYWVAQPWFA